MALNMNELFDKFTNFKIKHTTNPTPTEIGNTDMLFTTTGDDQYYRNVLRISHNEESDQVIVLFGNIDEEKKGGG